MAWAHNFKPPSGIPAGGKSVWGGANGQRDAFSATHQPPAALKSAGHMDAEEHRKELRKRRVKGLAVIDKLYERALAEDADLQAIVAAARQYEASNDRIDGKPNQSISGPGEGPVVTEVRYKWAAPVKRPDDGG